MKKVITYLRLFRIKHYIKNLLILFPLFFSGGEKSLDKDVFFTTIFGTVAFCFVSSAVYIINDIRDYKKDCMHPVKCKRPIASGKVSVRNAVYIDILLLGLTGVFLHLSGADFRTHFCCVIYLFVNLAYSFGLKNIPVLDITFLGAGYLLRVLYGGFLSKIPVSSWLFLTVLCVSFYLGLGKRKGELADYVRDGQSGGTVSANGNNFKIAVRPVLEKYTLSYLDNHMYLCLGAGLVFYSLWAMEKSMALVYTVPLVLVICMKYNLLLVGEADGDPVNTMFSSKGFLILLLLYAMAVFSILYFF